MFSPKIQRIFVFVTLATLLPLGSARNVIHGNPAASEAPIRPVPGYLQARGNDKFDHKDAYDKLLKLLHEIYGNDVGKVLQDPEWLTQVCSQVCSGEDGQCHEACASRQIGYLDIEHIVFCATKCEHLPHDNEAYLHGEYGNCLVPCLLDHNLKYIPSPHDPEVKHYKDLGISNTEKPIPEVSPIQPIDGKLLNNTPVDQEAPILAEAQQTKAPILVEPPSNGDLPEFIADVAPTPTIIESGAMKHPPTSSTSIFVAGTTYIHSNIVADITSSTDSVLKEGLDYHNTVPDLLDLASGNGQDNGEPRDSPSLTKTVVTVDDGTVTTVTESPYTTPEYMVVTFNGSTEKTVYTQQTAAAATVVTFENGTETTVYEAPHQIAQPSGFIKHFGTNSTNKTTSSSASSTMESKATSKIGSDLADGASAFGIPFSFGSSGSVLLAVVIGFGLVMG
ncbi:hypothetical protein BDZ91DRAFT_717128 [Kalaharituber pfeilii]|nr:hypothetical protein BDZ91DRAFT_717128 [Kalaharituber pfeilii]